MFPLRTILAATDFTPRSRAVVPRGAFLARLHGAKLVVVHALPPAAHPTKRLRLRKTKDPRAHAEAEFAKLRETLGDIRLAFNIVTEPPELSIPRLAQETGADLIVLGLHVQRRVLETLRLTTLERITQSTPCPVLIAHDQTIRPYRKVLGAITFAPASARALEVAIGLAPDAEFHAIHAVQLSLGALRPAADMLCSAEMTEADLLRQAFMNIEGLPLQLALPEIVPGGVHEVLRFRIEELQPDLVVIGSHSGRDPKRLGKYARDLMRAPPTDMLVAKPDRPIAYPPAA